jgi:Protein of unknown function (DUF4058)
MTLQDHFRPPLSLRRHWHAFHNAWATYIASDLNAKLPEGYFAEPNVQFGIEIDVAAFDDDFSEAVGESGNKNFVLNLETDWIPSPPSQSLPFLPTAEAVEVNIFNTEGGPVLAGAIELVSPANKDRASHRNAFVSKCETFLSQGIGLIIVDVVTERKANLHNELLKRIGGDTLSFFDIDLYATSYRPVERKGQIQIDIWQEAMTIGSPLPTLPLWLRGNNCLPVDLDGIYQRTCRESRILVNG